MRAGLALVMVGLLTGCVSGTPTGGQTVLDSYQVYQINWNTGPQVNVFVGLHEVEGKVAVCGLYTVAGDSAVTTLLNNQLLGSAKVAVDGDTLLQGLSYLIETPYIGADNADYVGKPTTCRLTRTAWSPEFSKLRPRISIPRQRVVI